MVRNRVTISVRARVKVRVNRDNEYPTKVKGEKTTDKKERQKSGEGMDKRKH